MTIRRVWLSCAGLAMIALVALLFAASRDVMVREFSNRAADEQSVALLRPPQRVCEGPVASPAQTRAVGIWGGSVIGVARLTVAVEDAGTGSRVASGKIDATKPTEYIARLTNPVPGGQPLRICLMGNLNTFSLLGSPATDPNAAMSGGKAGMQFSLALLNDKPSLLSSLPTAFSRASLWRPSWLGSWTFWVLAVALLGTFGLGVAAVASAASADDEHDQQDDDELPGGDLGPSPHGQSETSKDRPQTVT